MLRHALSLATAALVAGGLLTAAPAAHAATIHYVQATGDKLPYRDCADFDYSWAASDDSGLATEWSATVTLRRPDGEESSSATSSGTGGQAGDSRTVEVCWDEGAGSYELEVAVTFVDAELTVVDSGVGYGSLELTREAKPTTRSTLKVSDRTPHYRERVAFTVGSKIRRLGEWGPYGEAYVVLAVRCATPDGDTGWVTLVEGQVNRRGLGRAEFIYDIPRSWRCKFVSATPRTRVSKASISDPVRVRTSGSASARPDVTPRAGGARGAVLADGESLADVLR